MIDSLTHLYSGFLRRRRALSHYGPRPLADALAGKGQKAALPPPLANALLQAAREEPAAALARLGSSAEGLTAAESAARVARDGPNEVAHEAPLPA